MHELAIAQSVVDIACRYAAGKRITRVELRVGRLRQVVPSALTFSFELVAQGTPAEGAQLALESVPATAACRECNGHTTLLAFPLQCESCGSSDLDILTGDELDVETLEIEEDDHAAVAYPDSRR